MLNVLQFIDYEENSVIYMPIWVTVVLFSDLGDVYAVLEMGVEVGEPRLPDSRAILA